MRNKPEQRNMTMRATRKVAQLVDSTWDAVANTVDKGVLLIRRRQGQRAEQCPFLCYELIRRG